MKYAVLFLLSACAPRRLKYPAVTHKFIGSRGNVPTVLSLHLRVNCDDPKVQGRMADWLYRLYQYDTRRNPGKKVGFYGIIADPRGVVLSYNPERGILTVSTDRGTHWGRAYLVDPLTLERIAGRGMGWGGYPACLQRLPAAQFVTPRNNAW